MAKEKKTVEHKSQTEKSYTIYKTRKQLFIDNLIGGIAWGLGSGVGATIVLALLGFLLAQSQELPFIGQIVKNAINTIGNATNF